MHLLRIAAPALIVLLGFSTRALGQALPATADTKDRDTAKVKSLSPDDVVEISPFVVSTDRDTGYIAADTLNAGRLSTNLLKTPSSIDVLTRDLLNDLGILNTDEASAWLTSARPIELGATEGNSMNPSSLATSDSGTNVSLRGLGANPGTRDYFTSGSTPKEYNVERVEAARGPNAILYGEGGPGGSLNYITKTAKSRDFTVVRLRWDDFASKGIALDFNRRLTSNLDLRYNFSFLDRGHFIERNRFKELGNAINLTYRPFKRTEVSISADLSDYTRPGLVTQYVDQYAKWDRLPVVGKLTLSSAALTAKGLANWTGTKSLTWIDGIGMIDLAGYARTTGYGLPQSTELDYGDAVFPSALAGTPSVSTLPRIGPSFNANPNDLDVTDRTYDLQASVKHTFKNNLSVEVAGQNSKIDTRGGNYFFTSVYIDPQQKLPDGSNNPNFGKPFTQQQLGRRIDFMRASESMRFVAAYPVKIGDSTTTISAFLLQQRKNEKSVYTDAHIREPANSTVSITDASSLIRVFRYFDNLTPSLPNFYSMYDLVDVPTVDGRIHQRIQAGEVAASGSYFNDTLSVIAGFRRDSSALSSENGDTASRDTKTGQFTTYTVDYRKAFNNTTTVGLVYFPIKWLGVYANHGEGFIIQTISAKRLDGSFSKANIVPSEEQAAGLRFQFGNEKGVRIVGSVGYYQAEQQNAARTVNIGNVNTLWRDLGTFEGKDYSNRYIQTFFGDPFSTSGSNSITSSQSTVGSGWEASLTANVGRSFRLIVNAALPKTKQADVAADYVAYVRANMPTWEALANNAGNPNKTADAGYVAQINQTITSFTEGRSLDRTYKYQANVFGIYTINKGPLKGLRVGGGARFYGQNQIGSQIGLPFNYVYARAYHIANAQIGYPLKVSGMNIDLQLNVDNVLGYDRNIINGLFVHTLNGQSMNIPYGQKAVWPRSARITATIKF